MRRISCWIVLLIMLGSFFSACSTDVDLYADYKNITVVYGLLDCDKDTNYIKINKAFLGPGNAYEIAQIADSCNYPYKLDAQIIEYRASASSNKYQVMGTYPLDTITIHNKKPGIFYAPDQLVYYTTRRIHSNDERYKYKYGLQIDRGDTILTSETEVVGGEMFMIDGKSLNLTAETGSVKWYECPNAAVYEVVLNFYFTEVYSPTDSVQRCMSWSLGTHSASSLTMDHGKFVVNYKSDVFYANMAKFLGNDTLNTNVYRLINEPCIGIAISAGGEELYNFITVNGPSSSIVQSIPEYTNILGGGYGVFSSRAAKEQMVKMSSHTGLTSRENWRFRQGR